MRLPIKDREIREIAVSLLNEIRRHKRKIYTESTQITSPNVSRALGELMALDMVSPFVFLGEVNFRLTKKGLAFILGIEESEIQTDSYGYVSYWRD